jgi:hypothetical protein
MGTVCRDDNLLREGYQGEEGLRDAEVGSEYG